MVGHNEMFHDSINIVCQLCKYYGLINIITSLTMSFVKQYYIDQVELNSGLFHTPYECAAMSGV